MICYQLFRTFFLIGLFSFGGGYASMELIRSRVVEMRHWLSDAEFTDIISIAEMTPGPLGINIASFVGTRTAGVPGMIAATAAYVLPALILMIVFARVYYRCREQKGIQGVLMGLRPAVAAMVLSSAVRLTGNAWWDGGGQITLRATNWAAVALTAGMLLLLRKKKLGPIAAILTSGVLGALIYALLGL